LCAALLVCQVVLVASGGCFVACIIDFVDGRVLLVASRKGPITARAIPGAGAVVLLAGGFVLIAGGIVRIPRGCCSFSGGRGAVLVFVEL
jgi:hypothetical protein